MYISGSTSGNYMTGMSSGLDVDQMVKELMDAERIPYDSYEKDKQYLEWQLEAYQSSASTIQSFQNDHFDFLNPEDNLLSSSTYMTYDCTSSHSSVSASVADADMADSQYTMEVDQVATSATMTSDVAVSKAIEGSQITDYTALDGSSFMLTVDGDAREVMIEDKDGNGSIDSSDIQTSVDDTFGSGKLSVTDNGGKLSIDTIEGSGSHVVSLDGSEAVKINMGFSASDSLSNRIDPKQALAVVSSSMVTPFTVDVDGMVTMTINGVTFEFDEDTSLEHMMETINSDSEANVTMTYNTLSDSFELVADQTGMGSTLKIDESGSSFLSAAGLNTVVEGQDMVATINGEKTVRSTNSFEVDGVVFTVNEVTTEPVTINVALNTDNIYDTVIGFVADYNALVEAIQGELNEERDYDYDPLTQAARDEMTDEEIDTWEEQAQAGILGNDDLLESMLEEMRVALYSPVEGCSLTLADLGITTHTYDNGGKLTIDETKLKATIEESPEDVVQLFTKPSETHPGTGSARTLSSEEMGVRREEEGLMYRLYDITETYVSTTSDSNGNKGLLVEKCGFSDDYTELDSTLYQQLQDMEDRLAEMEEELMEKEENHYMEFSYMETYIAQMNSQMQMIQGLSA